MDRMKKISNAVEKICGAMIVFSFSVMIVACVLQVFTRYVLNTSLSWTEELARYMFIWSNLLGAAICVRWGSHATVTAVFDLFPARVQRALRILIQAVVAGLSLLLAIYGFRVAYVTRIETSPALKISMSLINAAVPVSGILMVVFSVFNIVQVIFEGSEGGTQK